MLLLDNLTFASMSHTLLICVLWLIFFDIPTVGQINMCIDSGGSRVTSESPKLQEDSEAPQAAKQAANNNGEDVSYAFEHDH